MMPRHQRDVLSLMLMPLRDDEDAADIIEENER